MKWEEGIKILWTDALRKGRTVEIPVNGDSMFPILRDGDRVTAEAVIVGNLRVGDIVLFESSSRLILHRIISIQNIQWITCRGDFTHICDAPVTADSIIGKITHRIRNNKKCSLNKGRFLLLAWLVVHLRPFFFFCSRIWKKIFF